MPTLPAPVLSALHCPICKAPLHCGQTECVCAGAPCGARFPLVDGVPILINEQNSLFKIADFVQRRPTTAPPHEPSWRKALKRLTPRLSKNYSARQNYAIFADLLLSPSSPALPAEARGDERPWVLILGAGSQGEGLEQLLKEERILLVHSDVSFGPRTALIADAHDIPFGDDLFAGVIIQAVLEHVVDPQRCVAEIWRVLQPAGLVYAETPFMQQVHEGRYDFTRYTHLGHRRLFRRFEEIRSGPVAGPGMALGWAWAYFLMSLAGSRRSRSALYLLARLTGWPLKHFDRWLLRRPGAYDAGAGYYFLGRKSQRTLPDGELILSYRGAQ